MIGYIFVSFYAYYIWQLITIMNGIMLYYTIWFNKMCTTFSIPFSCVSVFIRARVILTWRVPLVEQELPTLPEHLSSPSALGSCNSIFGFMCMFCRSLFVFLYFFLWPSCCLFFFDLRILITPLLSSNSFVSSAVLFSFKEGLHCL